VSAVYLSVSDYEKIKELLADMQRLDWSTRRNKDGMTVGEQFTYLLMAAEDVEMILERCARRVINGTSKTGS